jgi:hypothetical protein
MKMGTGSAGILTLRLVEIKPGQSLTGIMSDVGYPLF